MKITFIGTCSGTEPMPNMHHCSLVFEINGTNYWFDAGENCSHAAYTSGISLSNIRSIFISHMHIDHIGGLANLIYTINKLVSKLGKPHINDGKFDIYIPDPDAFASVRSIAYGHRSSAALPVKMIEHVVHDGVIFDDENVKVTANHTTHLGEDGSNGWHAFSYLIEAEGKRVVFSGDVGAPSEIDALVGNGCDLVIMETGHHTVTSVLDYMQSRNIKRLLFNHHGREIIADRDAAKQKIKERGVNAEILRDMQVEII